MAILSKYFQNQFKSTTNELILQELPKNQNKSND